MTTHQEKKKTENLLDNKIKYNKSLNIVNYGK